MNSVMVSRINVAAEGMTPQRIGFRRIPAHELEDVQPVAPAEVSLTGVERLVALAEDDWASTDDVARARVAWAGRLQLAASSGSNRDERAWEWGILAGLSGRTLWP